MNPARCDVSSDSDAMATGTWAPEDTGNIIQHCLIIIIITSVQFIGRLLFSRNHATCYTHIISFPSYNKLAI